MHHSVDSGGGGHSRRQAKGQLGIEQRQIRQQQRRDHAHFGGFTSGDNGNLRDFRTGTGGGRYQNQRQTLTQGIANAVDLRQLLAALRMRQQRHQLGHIHRTAAAKANDQLRLKRLGLLNRRQQNRLGRIGDHLIEYLDGQLGARKAWQHGRQQAELADAWISDDQHPLRAALAAQLGQTLGGADLTQNLRRGGKAKGQHWVILLL